MKMMLTSLERDFDIQIYLYIDIDKADNEDITMLIER